MTRSKLKVPHGPFGRCNPLFKPHLWQSLEQLEAEVIRQYGYDGLDTWRTWYAAYRKNNMAGRA